MGRIQSDVGLVTGIKISDTVDKLMAVESQPRTTLQSRLTAFKAEQTAITQLTVVTLGVQLAGRQLNNASVYSARAATSGDTKYLTSAVRSNAAVGDYQFTPVRKAQTHQVQSSGFATRDQAIGAGEFKVRTGGFLQSGVDLQELNGGAGVARGKIRITDRSGASAVIDLRFAKTIDDVLQTINSTDSINVTASTAGDRLVLTDNTGASASNLKVQEVSGGTTAAGLGLAGIDAASTSATGNDVLRLSESFSLGRLNDGNGLSIRSGADLSITFRDGSTPLAIDFDDEKTVGELLDTINAADPTRLKAELSADGDRLVLTDLTAGGGTFAIASTTNGTLAEDLGLTGTASGAVLTGSKLQGGLQTSLLRSLNGGQGLGGLGSLSLTDRSGATATVNLAAAETIDDVISAINGAGVGIRASYNQAGNGIQLTDKTGATTSNLIVANGDGTNTADKLKLSVNAAQTTKDSGELNKQILSEGTLLSRLNGGKGVAQNSFILTDTNGLSASISFAQLKPKTLGDVIDAINALPTAIRAKINDTGDGILLQDTAHGTDTLKIQEVGSGTAAKDLKLLAPVKTVTIGGQPTQVIDGTTTVTATLDADDTLEDLVTKLNGAGGSFKASIIDDGSWGNQPFHLSLLSTAAGKSGRLLATSTLAGVTFQDVVHGQDALLVAGDATLGRLVSSSSNTFVDIVPGVDVTVQGETTSPVTVSVTTSNTTFVAGIKQFVSQYNSLRDKLDSLDYFKTDDGSRGVLFGSSETLRIRNDVSRFVTGRFFGLGAFRNLSQLGVTLDESGKLTVNEDKLKAAYDKDPAAVEKFFTDKDQGFVTKLNKTIDGLAGEKNSVLINRVQSLNDKVERSNLRLSQMDTQLAKDRERLLTTFYNLETAISKLQNNLTAITNLSQNVSLASFANTSRRN